MVSRSVFYLLVISTGSSIAGNLHIFRSALSSVYFSDPVMMYFNSYGEAIFEVVLSFSLVLIALVGLTLAYFELKSGERPSF